MLESAYINKGIHSNVIHSHLRRWTLSQTKYCSLVLCVCVRIACIAAYLWAQSGFPYWLWVSFMAYPVCPRHVLVIRITKDAKWVACAQWGFKKKKKTFFSHPHFRSHQNETKADFIIWSAFLPNCNYLCNLETLWHK